MLLPWVLTARFERDTVLSSHGWNWSICSSISFIWSGTFLFLGFHLISHLLSAIYFCTFSLALWLQTSGFLVSFSLFPWGLGYYPRISHCGPHLYTEWVGLPALPLLSSSISWEFFSSVQFSSVQSLSHVRLFATPWITARQASLSITNSRSSLRPTSIESVMPSSHLILCRPLLLLPPILPSIRVFSNESTLHMSWPKSYINIMLTILMTIVAVVMLFFFHNI